MSYHLCSLTVGDGSDDFPFIISISSKAVLSLLLCVNESLIPVVFHMDSTFKCNENEFPVTLLGISDANRHFHLLSISVVSHHTCDVYICLITSLQELVAKGLPGISFQFKYCMADCEIAERYVIAYLNPILFFVYHSHHKNCCEMDYIILLHCSNGFQLLFCALTSCLHRAALLSCFPGIQHLMCFFHIKQACQKQLHGKPMKDQKEMLKDITELHSSASFDE
jgi:hypothetical protein